MDNLKFAGSSHLYSQDKKLANVETFLNTATGYYTCVVNFNPTGEGVDNELTLKDNLESWDNSFDFGIDYLKTLGYEVADKFPAYC
jgi:hypothetical protein